MLSIVIPTRNRPRELERTLGLIAELEWRAAPEVIVVDNGSEPPARAPGAQLIRLEENRGAAARNLGVTVSGRPWVMMLDDDSAPVHDGVIDAIASAPPDVAAIGAEIRLPDGRRESGGLPEVPVGCGVAYQRRAYLEAGGYDERFEYYAEEYDLAARLIVGGWRIAHDRRFEVLHRKVRAERDVDRIVRLLVRNNVWVRARYAPRAIRDAEIAREVSRYREIAIREGAEEGFERGLSEFEIESQPRREMSNALYERFTGALAAREGLGRALNEWGAQRVAIVERGKGVEVIERVIGESGAAVATAKESEVLVVGSLSPGPMLDGVERMREGRAPALGAWTFGPSSAPSQAGESAASDSGSLERPVAV